MAEETSKIEQYDVNKNEKRSDRKFGDFEITRLSIECYDGFTVPITQIYRQLNLYEGLFEDTLSGDITITNTTGLDEILPIIGNESLIINFRNYSNDTDIIKKFRIYKNDIQEDVNASEKDLTLHFISIEKEISLYSKVKESFGIYNKMKISDIVDFIYTKYLYKNILENEYKKSIFIEETSGLYNLSIPNYTPIKTFNFLTKYAITSDNLSNFIFYESMNGFYFMSLDSIIKYSNTIDVPKYSFVPLNITDNPKQSSVSTKILAIDADSMFDRIDNLTSGFYSCRKIGHDMIQMRYNTQDYSYIEPSIDNLFYGNINKTLKREINKNISDFEIKHRLNPNLLTNELDSNLGNSFSKVFLTSSNYNINNVDYIKNREIQNNLNKEVTFLNKKIKLTELNNKSLTIDIYGDVTRKIGDVIEIDVPSISSNEKHRYLSGKYLVSNIMHIFNPNKYIMRMRLLSDSHSQEITNNYTDSLM